MHPDGFKAFLVLNQFAWLKDGLNKMDDFKFKNDGTMMALSNQDEGTYRVINIKIICVSITKPKC